MYLQFVIVAVGMIFHVKLENGDGDATAKAGVDVPDALAV